MKSYPSKRCREDLQLVENARIYAIILVLWVVFAVALGREFVISSTCSCLSTMQLQALRGAESQDRIEVHALRWFVVEVRR